MVLLLATGNATMKTRAFCGQPTQGSITRHAQVSREPSSIMSLLSVWRSIYQTSNRVSLSSEDAKRIIFEGTGNGCERGRLQKVVDKGLRLICLDAQAIYAITIGTEGIKHTKLDKLPIGQIRGDIVFLIPCFLNFL